MSTSLHPCVYFHCPGGPATPFPLSYEVIHLLFNIFRFLFLATEKVLSDPEILSCLFGWKGTGSMVLKMVNSQLLLEQFSFLLLI